MVACRTAFGGDYAEPIYTERDIQRARSNLDEIDIRNLALKDYPLLSKFTGVKRIRVSSIEGTSATDEKLKALGALNLTNIIDISLLNCQLVTDEGIRALAKIRSVKMLQLEGTAITDAALEIMASQMRLTGVNVANCSGVTAKGLKALTSSDTLQEFGFSADNVTQDEVMNLIASFKKVTWCSIVDLSNKLDSNALRIKGAERKIHVAVTPTGSLQDMKARLRKGN